ncbi:MAG: hypothetical protein WA766_03115 [Candidatus Acidiferrales bacterium]
MNPAAFANVIRALWKITFSSDPEMVKGRKELEDAYKQEIYNPFMAGWNGEPNPPKEPDEWRISQHTARIIIAVLAIAGGVICFWSWFATNW